MNSDNSAMKLDPKLAMQLFADGAVLIIAGVPPRTEFGIDLCSYTISDNFRGVKMIPPGLHYVWCASQGHYGDVAPRVGFVHFFHKNEILVREWDNDIEELRTRQICQDAAELECKRIRDNLRQLDKFLAAYDYRFASHWKNLTDTITQTTMERCRPELGSIRSNIELQSCSDAERPRGPFKGILPQKVKMDEEDLLPKLKPIAGTAPRFSEVPTRVPKDVLPADVSRHHMDCIAAIDLMLATFQAESALIEEIQLAFVFYLVGYSMESLEHWRKLLGLLSHSENAVTKYKLLYMKYSEVLRHQLPRLPEELMMPTPHNSVYKDVRSLLVNLHRGGLESSSAFLAKALGKFMKWEFGNLFDDDPEDLPVLVESTEVTF